MARRPASGKGGRGGRGRGGTGGGDTREDLLSGTTEGGTGSGRDTGDGGAEPGGGGAGPGRDPREGPAKAEPGGGGRPGSGGGEPPASGPGRDTRDGPAKAEPGGGRPGTSGGDGSRAGAGGAGSGSGRPAGGEAERGFAALDAGLPILLAPVRIETRFSGPRLRIRIFPDPAFICSLEAALTRAEERAVEEFWQAVRAARGNRAGHLVAWRELAAGLLPHRAAWVAARTRPEAEGRRTREAGAGSPARAAWLPAHWVAVGYVGGERVLTAPSLPVRADLAFSVDPNELDPEAAGLKPGAEGAWLFDFGLALEAGMAIDAPLPEAAEAGLDRIFVVGVPRTEAGAGPLSALLTDALFGRGAGFAPQGAPTSNTAEGDSAWLPLAADLDGEFARHFPDLAPEGLAVAPRIGGALATPGGKGVETNAAVLRRALGLTGDPLDRFVHAGAAEGAAMRAMNVAMWPVSWGRYMTDLLAGEERSFFSAADVARVRDLFVGHVRGGGPLPALRLGASPFGIALCEAEGTGADPDPRRAEIRSLIGRLRGHWRSAARGLPRLADETQGGDADPGALVLKLLSLTAHPATFETRNLRDVEWGLNFVYDAYTIGVFDRELSAYVGQVAPQNVDYLAGELGRRHAGAESPGEQREAFETVIRRLSPFDVRLKPGDNPQPKGNEVEETVSGERVAVFRPWQHEREALWLHIAELRLGPRPPDPEGPIPDLAQAMWDSQADQFVPKGDALRAVFIAIADILGLSEKALEHLDEHAARNLAFRLAEAPPQLFRGTMGDGHNDPRIAFGAYASEARPFTAEALVMAGRGEQAVPPADYLDYERRRVLHALGRGPEPGADPLAETARPPLLRELVHEAVGRAALGLDGEARGPRAEMEELAEALGTLGSLPTGEIELLLRQTLGLASWRLDAWTTGLASERLAEVRKARGTGLHLGHFGFVENLRSAATAPRVRREGYVHTPSLTHAKTAAVLRAGWRARGEGQAADPLAVNLSSARMRTAAWCFDALRQGADLGAVLGARFERRLSEAGEAVWIDPVRRAVLAISGEKPDRGDPVVDGLDLSAIWRGGAGRQALADAMTFADGSKAAGIDKVAPALKSLDAALDAMADAALADATHALVQGDASRAGATLAAISTGTSPPPRLDVLNSPEIGTVVTTSVCLLTDPEAASPWGAGATPRAEADPLTEALAQAALGAPQGIAFRVRAGKGKDISVTLADLRASEEWRLGALDLLAMLGDGASGGSPLARWICRFAEATRGAGAGARLVQGDAAQDDMLLRLRAWRDVLLRGRALAPRDLPSAGEQTEGFDLGIAAETLAMRVEAMRKGYAAAATALARALPEPAADLPEPVEGVQPARVAAALQALVRYGHADALASADELCDGAAIGAKAWRVLAAARQRLGRLARAPARDEPDACIRWARTALRKVLGPSVPGCVPLKPASASALAEAFAGSDRRLERHPEKPLDWLDRIGLARPDLGRLAEALMVDAALGVAPPAIGVGQLPADDAGWCAVTAPADGRQRHALLALRLGAAGPVAPGKTGFAGLTVDSVTDRIPAQTRDTGVAIEIETPNAEAPQCMALCLPPRGADWSLDAVVGCIDDLIGWAKSRAVDGALLDRFDQHLPAVFAAASLSDRAEVER